MRKRLILSGFAGVLSILSFFAVLTLNIQTEPPRVSLKQLEAASGDAGYPLNQTVYGQGYNADRQVAAFRTAVAVADTLTDAGMLATTDFILNGRQTVIVSPRFTNAAQTCVVMIAYVYKDAGGTSRVKGTSRQLTASQQTVAITDSAGRFYSPDLVFDGEGSSNIRVILVTAPGVGSVTFWVGSA